VEILRGTYNGQNPTRPVNKKIAATIPRIIARVPVMVPVI
jgi:hypothetical protein